MGFRQEGTIEDVGNDKIPTINPDTRILTIKQISNSISSQGGGYLQVN